MRSRRGLVRSWAKLSDVVPAKAGTHNHRSTLLKKSRLSLCPFRGAAAYGSLRSQGRRMIEFARRSIPTTMRS
jgi:hypothetical protein